jgi:hypothetical protein
MFSFKNDPDRTNTITWIAWQYIKAFVLLSIIQGFFAKPFFVIVHGYRCMCMADIFARVSVSMIELLLKPW